MSRRPHLLMLILAMLGAHVADAAPEDVIRDVRYGRHDAEGGFTRVVIELSGAVDWLAEPLEEDARSGRPERLFLDLEGVRLARPRGSVIPVRDDRVQRIRMGQRSPERTRVVIDLARSSRYRLMQLANPHRIVVDVYGSGLAAPAQAAAVPRAAALPDANARPAAQPAAAVAPAASSFGTSLDTAMDLTTTVTLEVAANTRDGHMQKSALIFEPELELALPWEIGLTTSGRLRYDAYDRLDPGRPSQPEVSRQSRRGHLGDQGEYELREFYLEREFGDLFLRAGKQHIVWGKADGLKVLDLVNPQDFREFVLEDFEDSRIPLWALNAELPIGDVTAQLLWILDQTYHDVLEQDALYAFTSERLVPQAPSSLIVEVDEIRRPRRVVRDSDVGLRLSTFLGGWDLTLNYLYHYHDVPVLARSTSLVPGLGVVVRISPRYERTNLVGATFSNAFGNFTVRGELGYSFDKSFTTSSPTDLDGVAESDEFSYVLGLDWFGMSESFFSVQLFQSLVRSQQRGFLVEDRDTAWSFLARRELRNDTIQLEVIWVHNANTGDGFVRPKISYDVRDDLRVWLGADVFYGDERGVFGQYEGLDRAVLGVEWTR